MAKSIYIFKVLLFIFCMLSFSFPAFSANVAFLYDTPAQYFNDQDWKMLEASTDDALNNLPNGKSITWRNPKTGNGGSLMPLNSIKKHRTICRDLQMTNYAHHRKDQYVFMFCKFGKDWKIPTKSV